MILFVNPDFGRFDFSGTREHLLNCRLFINRALLEGKLNQRILERCET
jgi:hypothetical protein